MFSRWQKYQIKILETGFPYLPRFPITFQVEKVIPFTINSKALKVFFILVALNFASGIVGILIEAIYVMKLSPDDKFETSRFVMLLLNIFSIVVTIFVAIVVVQIESISGLNQLNLFQGKLLQKGIGTNPKFVTYLDQMLCCLFCILSLSPIVLFPFLMVEQVDSYYQLINILFEILPVHPILSVIKGILDYTIRPFLIVYFFEILRTISYLAFGIGKLWTSLFMVLNTMSIQNSESISKRIEWYCHLTLVYKLLQNCAQKVVSFGLTMVFWIAVVVAWFVITQSELIPVLLYCWIFNILIFGVACVQVALHMISNINEMSNAFVYNLRCTSKLTYMKCPYGWCRHFSRINWKKALSIQRIEINVSDFAHIDKEFSLDFLKTLSDRFIDALLIF